ncbi:MULTISPECIES: ATP/GTP-binding protein [Lactobacillaceae]|uniref:AAA family ATPase n=1 Tax=Lactobacillaceae TaxID=33958 RepID=UPI001456ED26|nr:ATP-binding protein [Lactobacillus sp. HBUAS51381]NLR10652.1 ATP-binding protein [Lactobacillus sp. HBUAS51381]
MLHQFTFKNYRSFRDEVTLDLTASTIKELPADVVTDVLHERILKLAAMYGANASGKSNVIKAFQAMTTAVLSSFSDDEALLKIEPYWFSEATAPTEFSVLFSTPSDIFQYGFSCAQGVVIEEYLYQRDKDRIGEQYRLIFDRSATGISGEIATRTEVQTLGRLVEPETLLLSALARLNLPVIKGIDAWFRHVRVIDYGNPRGEMMKGSRLNADRPQNPLITLLEDPQEKARFEAFVHAVDVGIAGLGLVSVGNDLTHDIRHQQRVVAYHRNPKTGELMQTPIAAESSGTRKMLMLYVDLKQVLDQGQTLLIDELDAKLHPLLLRYILIMFHDPEINPHGAQLIFTTQELFTLDKDNFRRDEVWFVNKDEAGVSDLYALDSIRIADGKKVRNDASYGKDYILGKFKATPNLKRLGEMNG